MDYEALRPKLESMIAQQLMSRDNEQLYLDLLQQDMDFMISDIRCKAIKEIVSSGKPLTQDRIIMIAEAAGDMDGISLFDASDDEWTEDVAKKYAEHLRNYLYTYKEEAADIDPSIDTEEEQIGIMAQDLENVNPSCVKELEDGTKVVDTNKLALMNAGVIADIVRRLEALEGKNG